MERKQQTNEETRGTWHAKGDIVNKVSYKLICEKGCIWFQKVYGEEYVDEYHYYKILKEYWYCSHPKRMRGIGKYISRCPLFQTHLFKGEQLVRGEKKMVNINEIPQEQPRVDLDSLPKTNELIAISETIVEATPEKTGGLVITFKQRDQKVFPQKYSKVSGSALITAMTKLGFTDTKELQKVWCTYELTAMRTGYPRYIPVKKLSK